MSEPFLGQVKLPFGLGSVPGWTLVPVIVIAIGLPAGYAYYNGSGKPGPSAPGNKPPPLSLCGDGVLGPIEECEHEICVESTLSTTGQMLCFLNVGCNGGNVCNPSTCHCQPSNICGNGVAETGSGEQCDGDDLLKCDPGMECSNDCLCVTPFEVPQCGDGVVNGTEQCDGENVEKCDPGMVCSEDCLCVTLFEVPTCGDGVKGDGESCDYVPCGPSQGEDCFVSVGCEDQPGTYCESFTCSCQPYASNPLPPDAPPDESSSDPCEGAARVETFDVYDCSFDSDSNHWVYFEGMRCYDEAGNMTYDARTSEAKISEVWLSFCPNPLGNEEPEEPQEPGGRNPFSGP